MKTIVIIPARYGSQRFKGKPLALIAGKPMIQRVYEQACKAKGVDQVYIATDDERIKAKVESFNGQYVMTSPNAQSGTDRIEEAANLLALNDDDLLINVQGDQPFVHPEVIEQLAELFQKNNRDFEMATLGFELKDQIAREDPNQVKMVFDKNGYALYFSRAKVPFGRDSDNYTLYKHLGIYAYTKRFISRFAKLPMGRLESIEKLEQLRALENGDKIMTAITTHHYPEVDVPADIELCENWLLENSDKF